MSYILIIIQLLEENFNVKIILKMFKTIIILEKVLNNIFCSYKVECIMSLNLVFYN